MENEIQEQPTTTPEDFLSKIKKFLTPKKIIIGSVLLLLIVIFMLLLRLPGKKITTKNTPVSESFPTFGLAYFDPIETNATIGIPQSADIAINSEGKAIIGVILSVKYNPLHQTTVTLSQFKDPQSAFSSSLVQSGSVSYNTTQGTATLTLLLPKNVPAFSVNGKVARLTFTSKTPLAAILSSQITLMENTAFLQKDKGMHNQITKKPLNIVYQRVTNNPLPTTPVVTK